MDGCDECLLFLGGDAGGTRGGPGRTGGGRTVGDDGARGGGDLELLRRELQDRGERCNVRDTQPAYAIGGAIVSEVGSNQRGTRRRRSML